jgi:hypothetical protein
MDGCILRGIDDTWFGVGYAIIVAARLFGRELSFGITLDVTHPFAFSFPMLHVVASVVCSVTPAMQNRSGCLSPAG